MEPGPGLGLLAAALGGENGEAEGGDGLGPPQLSLGGEDLKAGCHHSRHADAVAAHLIRDRLALVSFKPKEIKSDKALFKDAFILCPGWSAVFVSE